MLQAVYQLLEDVFGSVEQVEADWKEKTNRVPLIAMGAATLVIMLMSSKLIRPEKPAEAAEDTPEALEQGDDYQ